MFVAPIPDPVTLNAARLRTSPDAAAFQFKEKGRPAAAP